MVASSPKAQLNPSGEEDSDLLVGEESWGGEGEGENEAISTVKPHNRARRF